MHIARFLTKKTPPFLDGVLLYNHICLEHKPDTDIATEIVQS